MEVVTSKINQKEKINFITQYEIKNEFGGYQIFLGTNEEENILIIKIIPEESKSIFFFQGKYSLIELQNASKAFNYYKSTKEIIYAFPKLKNKTFEKNDEFIIQYTLYSPEGEVELSELNIKKFYINKEKAIK